MMYSHLKPPDNTRIAYSNVLEDNTILVGVERPVDGALTQGIADCQHTRGPM